MRPCEEGKPCKYEDFDYGEDCRCCGIDFDGADCPYIKPWGKTKYRKDHGIEPQEVGYVQRKGE